MDRIKEGLDKRPGRESGKSEMPVLDFQDTATAFAYKTDEELKKVARLFGLMNKEWLVKLGARAGAAAVRLRFPGAERTVRETIYQQFVGGQTLLECQPSIEKLAAYGVMTILDYGAESKESEEDFNFSMNETIRTIEFAATLPEVPFISCKLTGLARFAFLESLQNGDATTIAGKDEYRNVLKRLDAICYKAGQRNISVFFDAEESWIQDAIDHLVTIMMRRYNRQKVVVANTYQLYRKDRLKRLIDAFNHARKNNYKLGVKLVRGAYLDKERDRAQRLGIPSPIHESQEATNDAFEMAVRFCLDNYQHILLCNASHNANSNLLQAQLIAQKAIPRDHPHLYFSQLYGMSDNLTFNLAKAGYNATKYMPYGPVRDVTPYLIRRTKENKAVTGMVNRELEMVNRELKRRGLS